MLRNMLDASWVPAFFVGCATTLFGCRAATEICVRNTSTLDFADVSVAGQPFGDIAAGMTSEYKIVRLRSKYASIALAADGHKVTDQTLNFGTKRFTYRIDVVNLGAGHLAKEVMGE